MASVCFFGSASDAAPAAAQEAARAFGAACARHGWRLVYGGSRTGLMATAAAAAMAGGGTVIGVMPKLLVARELADPGITALHVVDSLAARKQMMADLSDAFVALPGGVNLDTIAGIAETGVDFISVGRITQSAPAVDIGLDVALSR